MTIGISPTASAIRRPWVVTIDTPLGLSSLETWCLSILPKISTAAHGRDALCLVIRRYLYVWCEGCLLFITAIRFWPFGTFPTNWVSIKVSFACKRALWHHLTLRHRSHAFLHSAAHSRRILLLERPNILLTKHEGEKVDYLASMLWGIYLTSGMRVRPSN